MTLCDSNVWLALALSGHVHHAAARRWLNGVEGVAAVCCRGLTLELVGASRPAPAR